jgi:hypothetical protein
LGSRWLKLAAKSALVNLLPAELLEVNVSIEQSRQLFARFVDVVEIENHSYCNRVCWFCPNVFLDRRSATHLMDDELFARILTDLSSIAFARTLVWSRYHEPLANESIYGRIKQARSALPNALLVVTSNGDYLDRDAVAKLEEVGLDRLLLDLYLPEGREDDPEELTAAVNKFRKRTGLTVLEREPREYAVTGSRIAITMGAPLYSPESISTRGGLMDIPKKGSYRRSAVCLAPLRHVVIDYNGMGMLCCQTRSDSREQQEAIIGDLSRRGYSLFHYYRDLATARAALLSPGPKGGVCESCDVSDDGPDTLARRAWIAAALRRLPGREALLARLLPAGRRYDRP